MLSFKKEEAFGWYSWRASNHDGDHVLITQMPTMNCQIFSIGGFDRLIIECSQWVPLTEDEDDYDDDDYDNGGHYDCNLPKLKEEIQQIWKLVGKNQLLIDIYNDKDYTCPVNDLFAGHITFQTEYRNTTGRNMVMYLINLQSFINHA